jgi:imidazolonepropionase-like amidohydrolase
VRSTVVLCLVAVICAAAQVTAITNVTVIDPGTSSVRPRITVIIEDQRIQAVQPASEAVPARATRIDGAGRYLIPGLQDSTFI